MSLVPFMIKICYHVMRCRDMFFFLPTYFDLCICILELVWFLVLLPCILKFIDPILKSGRKI